MGWGNVQREHRRDRLRWSSVDLNVATAVGAAQLPAGSLLWYAHVTSGEDYGGGHAPIGLVCLFLLAPLWMPFLGLLHACVQTMPAATLARLTADRVRGPEWGRHLVWAAVLGVVWAVPAALLWGSFVGTAVVFATLGILPVLGVRHLRRRARGWGCLGLWLASALASLGLSGLAFGGAVLAAYTGLIEQYEPPKLSLQQLTGAWRGEGGTVLRLHPDGRAELTALPTESESRDWLDDPPFAVCDGTGTWHPERENRDAVAVRPGGGCGQQTNWTIGGTKDRPELFVLFGDPDAGDLRILTRD